MTRTFLGSGADISADDRYRYLLWRVWEPNPARVLFVLLNPSTADAVKPDPTLTRCLGFAEREGFGALSIVNLWALRSTNPRALRTADDPVGPDNDNAIREAAKTCDEFVLGWGASVRHVEGWRRRVDAVVSILSEFGDDRLKCLGRCKDRFTPRHPLMVRADQPLVGVL